MADLSRRDFIKITALGAGALAIPAAWLLSENHLDLTETRTLMGTIVHLTIITADERKGRAALNATFAEMERLIALYDHRQAQSPLARLNRDGQVQGAPDEFVSLMREALAFGALTRGAFDVTVKPIIDRNMAGDLAARTNDVVDYRSVSIEGADVRFGKRGMQATLDGIAKGKVVDGGVAVLRAHGYTDVIVEAGGDLLASGHGLHDAPWRLAITHPRPERLSGYIARFELTDRALATSGDYLHTYTADKRHHHIIDPHTGESPAELASVSVVAATATRADALSTALMVMPLAEGIALANSLDDVEALFVTKDLTIRRTDGFPV
jgi:thiamine biosynthesis lipoprotein